MVFSRSFRVWGLILRFICWHLHWMRERGLMSFFYMWMFSFLATFIEEVVFFQSVNLLVPLWKKKIRWQYQCGSILRSSGLPLWCMSIFMLSPCCLVIVFEIRHCDSTSIAPFLRNCLGYLVLLLSCEFLDCFPSSARMSLGFWCVLHWICRSLWPCS